MNCYVIGEKLSHTYSPIIHALFGNPSYGAKEVSPDEAEAFIRGKAYQGLNVTVPYKQTAFSLCDVLSETARAVGAVNTVVNRGGVLYGYNTDAEGFAWALRRAGMNTAGKTALILGSGGASRAVSHALVRNGCTVRTVSRTGELNYTAVKGSSAHFLINATPVGMYPAEDALPISLDDVNITEGVVDLIYRPRRTRLLQEGEKRGLHTLNGLPMLVYQAALSHQLFTGESLTEERVENVLHTLRRQTENILLIGLPSSGKTAVGKALAAALGLPFYDCDAVIEQKEHCPISSLIAKVGEERFREIETKTLAELCRTFPAVIATGGGAVEKEINRFYIKNCGKVILLTRSAPPDFTGRPLLRCMADYEALKKRRTPLYEETCDFAVSNDGDINDTVRAVLDRSGKEMQ